MFPGRGVVVDTCSVVSLRGIAQGIPDPLSRLLGVPEPCFYAPPWGLSIHCCSPMGVGIRSVVPRGARRTVSACVVSASYCFFEQFQSGGVLRHHWGTPRLSAHRLSLAPCCSVCRLDEWLVHSVCQCVRGSRQAYPGLICFFVGCCGVLDTLSGRVVFSRRICTRVCPGHSVQLPCVCLCRVANPPLYACRSHCANPDFDVVVGGSWRPHPEKRLDVEVDDHRSVVGSVQDVFFPHLQVISG